MTTGKTIALTRRTFVGKVMSLHFNMLSRLVITFFLRSKRLLISWLQSPSAVILEPRKIKSATVSTVSPSIFHEVMEPDAMIIVFWMLSFKPTFLLSSFTFIKRLFSSSSLSAIEWCHLHICCCCYVASVLSASVQPHRWQSTRLFHPWYSPNKNTGVGCHFLLCYFSRQSWFQLVLPPALSFSWCTLLLLLSRFSHVWLCVTP